MDCSESIALVTERYYSKICKISFSQTKMDNSIVNMTKEINKSWY